MADKCNIGTDKKRTEGTRLTKSSGPHIESSGTLGGPFTLEKNPSFLAKRVVIYDRIMEKQRQVIAGKNHTKKT